LEVMAMNQGESNESEAREQKVFSGRFPVRMPRYLHRQLTLVAREQGVSLSQFVCTAAVMAAGLNGGVLEEKPNPGFDRVGEEQYSQLWSEQFG
jgi:hypothetical protein